MFLADSKSFQPHVLPMTQGSIHFFSDDEFEKILIELSDSIYFVGPAKTISAAKKMTKELVKGTKMESVFSNY